MTAHRMVGASSAEEPRQPTGQRLAGVGATAMLIMGLLSACAPGGIEESRAPGIPESMQPWDASTSEPMVAWSEASGRLDVVTFGSSSCPTLVTEMSWQETDQITLVLGTQRGGACTADLAGLTSVIDISRGYHGGPLAVTLYSATTEERLSTIQLPAQP